MQCPKCSGSLRERERETRGGEVVVMDVCPACGGIWLDKGELEKLSESESRFNSGQSNQDGDDEGDGGHGGGAGRRGGRRGGFLGNLFDLGD